MLSVLTSDAQMQTPACPLPCAQTPSQLYVWVGAQCPPAFAAAAELSARLLPKYETVGSTEVVVCIQGEGSGHRVS